jgi:TPR repeat protein
MSKFTSQEYEQGVQDSLHWIAKSPSGAADAFAYGEYQFRIKDFVYAVTWYEKAAMLGLADAKFKLAYCMKMGLGAASDADAESLLFTEYLEERQGTVLLDEDRYRIGLCYRYGWGIEADEHKAEKLFESICKQHGGAMFELGLGYRDGTLHRPVDRQMAVVCLQKAYALHWEEAIFEQYRLFTAYDMQKEINDEFKKELTQAISFRLGRYLRVAEQNPNSDSLQRIADLYLAGYPWDLPEVKARFRKKADCFLKMIDINQKRGMNR